MTGREVGIRWTIGDVALEGFEALRLAAWGGWRVFGPEAGYTIVVNSMDVGEARARVGEVPDAVRWMAASGRMPEWMAPHVDEGLAEGKAWKFDPLQVYPDRWEIAFDNDCILWHMPASIQRWLDEGDRDRCLIAADVVAMHGQFSRPGQADEHRNGGIRGLGRRSRGLRSPSRLGTRLHDLRPTWISAPMAAQCPFVLSNLNPFFLIGVMGRHRVKAH